MRIVELWLSATLLHYNTCCQLKMCLRFTDLICQGLRSHLESRHIGHMYPSPLIW